MPAIPGKRQRGVEKRQHAENHRNVDRDGNVGEQAEQAVGQEHEDDDHDRADVGGQFALFDRVLAKARADRAFLDDSQRRRQRAGAQQDREFVRRLNREAAGYLALPTDNRLADNRGGDHLVIQHDCKALPDIFGRCLRKFARTGRIELKAHNGLA